MSLSDVSVSSEMSWCASMETPSKVCCTSAEGRFPLSFFLSNNCVQYCIIALHHCYMPRDTLLDMIIIQSTNSKIIINGVLTRLQVAHTHGMPGTFSPPPTSKETVNYRSRDASRHVRHARVVMHVGIEPRHGGENVPDIPSAYATHNFTNPARGPWNRKIWCYF